MIDLDGCLRGYGDFQSWQENSEKIAPYLATKGSQKRTLNRNGPELPRITPRAVSLRARAKRRGHTSQIVQIGVVLESGIVGG
jgi:hypothetical protein